MSEKEKKVSSLPLPPTEYIKLYTDENVLNGRAPRPPPPPTGNDVYSMFGVDYHNDEMIRSLESQHIKRLVPVHYDRRKELKKLNHSTYVNYLDLIDILIMNPESPKRAEKIDDISLIFINMHHLINEYRPHQARESLRVIMEMQKRSRAETILRFTKHMECVRRLVNAAFAALPMIMDDDEDEDQDIVKESIDMRVLLEALEEDTFDKNDPINKNDRILCKLVDEID